MNQECQQAIIAAATKYREALEAQQHDLSGSSKIDAEEQRAWEAYADICAEHDICYDLDCWEITKSRAYCPKHDDEDDDES